MRRALAVGVVVLCAAAGCASSRTARPGRPTTLTVDGLAAPIGVGLSDVYFGWHVDDARRDAIQSGYRIVVTRVNVARSTSSTAWWDSGRVSSADDAFVPYLGQSLEPDAVYRWQVQTWDANGHAGPVSAPATFETGLRDGDWRADWIRRRADTKTEPNQYTYARKEVTLAASPIVRARMYISGDQQYELNVNGARAGKGEAYSFPDSQYYETLDVTNLLRAGLPNALAITYQWDGPTKGHPAGEPGVIAQLSVDHADGHSETLVTDGTWRVRKAAWGPGSQRDLEGDLVDYTENIDARQIPVGWDKSGFDDTSWAQATVIGPAGVAPWTHLVSVRTRIVEEPIRAVSQHTLPSGAVVADFGAVYAAVPTVLFHHGVSGHLINMHAGYLLDPQGNVSTTRGTQHTDMSYSYVERGGVEQFHAFDYLGFRYLQIDNPGERLTPADVVALTRHTAVPDEHAATFSSSDATINAIFELGRHSALFCAQEQYIDTPTREKGSWLWDGFNESETAMSAFGEQNLTRKSLLEFAQSQARYWPNGAVNKIYPTGLGALDINEFTEIYPEWVWQYWMHTGDRALLARLYSTLVDLSNYVHNAVDRNGLVTNLPATNIYYDFPTVTRLNVLGVDVFDRVAAIAAALDRPASEITLERDRAATLTSAINRHLTRADGVYIDGLDANGAPVADASQDTNAAALIYGVVPAQRVDTVAAYIARLGMRAPPRTGSEVLDALAIGGRITDLVHILTNPTGDGWANILARSGTFTWEVWQPSDLNGDSMSHGWGSNVLVSIQQDLIGVTRTAPGYHSFAVSPPASVLTAARATLPTPQGTIAIAWQRQPSGKVALDVTVPANSTATIALPARGATDITDNARSLNGDPGVHNARAQDGTVTITVGAGTYHFISS